MLRAVPPSARERSAGSIPEPAIHFRFDSTARRRRDENANSTPALARAKDSMAEWGRAGPSAKAASIRKLRITSGSRGNLEGSPARRDATRPPRKRQEREGFVDLRQ